MAPKPIIDPGQPWKLPRNWPGFPHCGYRMSAAEWAALRAKARAGDAEAEWGVSDRYDEGCKDKTGRILDRRSPQKALEWLRRAAEHRNACAQNNLGVMLGNGDRIAKDTQQALLWLRRACRGGNTGCAVVNLAITWREIGNFRHAVAWFRKAAASGDGEALIQLGVHLYWGKGVRANPAAAVRCFRRATKSSNISDSGRDDGYFYLGWAYLEGRGVKQSGATAKKMFQRANIDNDHLAAQRALKRIG